MENNYIAYSFIVFGLITFFLAVKPTSNIKRFRNIFWVLGNVFFAVGLYLRYLNGHEVALPALMLLAANFGLIRQLKKENE